jgi:hypothetical protein
MVRLCRGDRAALGHLLEFLRSRQLIPAQKAHRFPNHRLLSSV